MYIMGVRWIEYNKTKFTVGKHDKGFLVLVNILTLSMIILVVL